MRSRRLSLLVLALAPLPLVPLSAAPDAWQQYSLELINRARASGAAEAARLGLSGLNEGPPDVNGAAWTIQNTAQPLAWNDKLAQAAQGHAVNLDSVAWLFNSAFYGDDSHAPLPPFPGAPGNEVSRISAAGYSQGARTGPVASNGRFPGLENVGYFAGLPADGWTAAEKTSAVEDIHAELFVDDSVPGRGSGRSKCRPSRAAWWWLTPCHSPPALAR